MQEFQLEGQYQRPLLRVDEIFSQNSAFQPTFPFENDVTHSLTIASQYEGQLLLPAKVWGETKLSLSPWQPIYPRFIPRFAKAELSFASHAFESQVFILQNRRPVNIPEIPEI